MPFNVVITILTHYNIAMNNHLDPEKLKIPAYMRKKAIVRQSKQKLILTALDRKQAGLDVHSHRAMAPLRVKEKSSAYAARQTVIKKSRATSFPAPSQQSKFLNDLYRDDQKRATEPYNQSIPGQKLRPQKAKHQFLRSLLPVQNEPKEETPVHESPTGCVEIVPIGRITAYFDKIQVAVIKLDKPLRLGDIIQITAEDMLFQQPVDSMQINRKPVKIAKKGSEIGLKISREPELNGMVYKVLI